jgi:hypothetical protein
MTSPRPFRQWLLHHLLYLAVAVVAALLIVYGKVPWPAAVIPALTLTTGLEIYFSGDYRHWLYRFQLLRSLFHKADGTDPPVLPPL